MKLARSSLECLCLFHEIVRGTMKGLALGYDYSLIFRTMSQAAAWPRERELGRPSAPIPVRN